MKTKTQLHVPVLVDRETYDAYKNYSNQTGVPVARVVREARTDALEMQKQSAAVGK